MTNSNTVQEIIRTSFIDADQCQVCIKCKYSYFSPDFLMGYCKHEKNQNQTLYPKMIDMYESCQNWERINKK